MKKVAVLIPVFNDQAGLHKTLKSLEEEKTLSLDIIVVDDGSNPSIDLPDSIGIHKIILIKLPTNKGIENALNEGLEYILKSGYEFVARIDAGDLSISNRFKKQYEYLLNHPNCVLVGADVKHVDEEGNLLFIQRVPKHHKQISRYMHLNSCFAHPAVMFRVNIIKEIGKYSYDYKAAEDYEYFFRIVKKYETANLNEVLVCKEYNANSISIKKRRTQLLSRLKVQLKYFDFFQYRSYLGLIQTLVLLLIPKKVILNLKKFLSKK